MTGKTTFGAVLAGCVLFGAASVAPQAALACEFTETSIYGGPLIRIRDGLDYELPQNVAFLIAPLEGSQLGEPFLEGRDDEGNPVSVEVERFGGDYPMGRSRSGYLYAAAEPIPVGTEAAGLVIGDYIDDQAPTAPRVLDGAIELNGEGCGADSCGEYTELRVQIEPASDDHVPSNALAYGIYLETSRARAASAAAPELIVEVSESRTSQLWSLVDEKWSDSEAWVSVSAFDAAGNESARTDPVRVNSESGACALGTRRRGGGFQLAAFVLVACAMVIRRLTKPRVR